MLSNEQIQAYYVTYPPKIPVHWTLGRRHFRVVLRDGRFVKLNHFQNRLTEKDLKYYCWKLKPIHVYFSVLNWLFPERIGKKYKARYCVPLNGEYVVDVDAYLMSFAHKHKVDDHWYVCPQCLEMSRRLTLHLCEIMKKYYSNMAVVFSGCQGFHVHVMDFDYHDWAPYREEDPIWCHHASRFKFTKLLQKQTHVFDRAHFTVSVDPMRVVTVPNTVNEVNIARVTAMATPQTSLEDALCSRVRIRILKLLARGELLTVTTIAAKMGVNYGSAEGHLEALEREEIVSCVRFGKRIRYYKWKESARTNAIRCMIEAWEQTQT
jgi:DNA-binding transcriptional ArsR family regulator